MQPYTLSTVLVAVVFVLLYFCTLWYHVKECKSWQEERRQLLDRLMAADYRTLIQGRIAETQANKPDEPEPESEWEPA